MYSVLERLGCSPKVPRPRHEKSDLDAQECRCRTGDFDRVRRRDESGPSWDGSQGVGSTRGEGDSAVAVGVRVEVPVFGGGLCAS